MDSPGRTVYLTLTVVRLVPLLARFQASSLECLCAQHSGRTSQQISFSKSRFQLLRRRRRGGDGCTLGRRRRRRRHAGLATATPVCLWSLQAWGLAAIIQCSCSAPIVRPEQARPSAQLLTGRPSAPNPSLSHYCYHCAGKSGRNSKHSAAALFVWAAAASSVSRECLELRRQCDGLVQGREKLFFSCTGSRI